MNASIPARPFDFDMDNDHALYGLIVKKQWEAAKSYLSSGRIEEEKLRKEVSCIYEEGNYSPLAAAIFRRAPGDLITQIYKIGGKQLLKAVDIYGTTPLHSACIIGMSDEVLGMLINESELSDLIRTNNMGFTPLDNLISSGSDVVGKVIIMQKRLYELDPKVEAIPSSTMQNLLRWANELPDQSDQDRILREPLIRIILNETFLHRGCLAILLADIYVKLAITFVYSFILYDIINGNAETRNAVIILSICLYWVMSRELSQIATTTLKNYVLDTVNWFDFSQMIFLVLSLRILASFDGQLYYFDRLIFMVATTIAWLEVLLAFGFLVKDIALFSVALIKIAGRLGPFFFTTIILIALFSHVFILANAGSNDLICASNQDVDWTCTISGSYFETVILLLTGELAFTNQSDGFVNMTPSILFGFAMGIFFLNISIAVITDAYNDVKTFESKRFTRNRLAFAAGSQSLLSILLIQRFCFRRKRWSTMASRKSGRSDEIKRIHFGTFLDWKLLENLSEEDQHVLKWWFESWSNDNQVPPAFTRMKVFFRLASFDEIAFPGKTFENILIGLKHRQTNSSILSSIFVRISSYILFLILVVCTLIAFIAGCISFGLLWPGFMRDSLFLEKIESNLEDTESNLETIESKDSEDIWLDASGKSKRSL